MYRNRSIAPPRLVVDCAGLLADQRTRSRVTGLLGRVALSYAVPPEITLPRRPRTAPGTPTIPLSVGRARQSVRPQHGARWSSSRVRLHLKLGQKRTKQLLAQYGDRLVCLRHRYDAQRRKCCKTVELIVAARDCEPTEPRVTLHQIVAFTDGAARKKVKQAGGHGIRGRRVWPLPYDRAVVLGTHSRIATQPASATGCPTASREDLHADARTTSR